MLRHSRIIILSVLVVFSFLPISCKEKAMPKPKGYFRIELPEKKYEVWNENYPFSFEYLKGALVVKDKSRLAEKYWLNIEYPKYNATLHLSYKDVRENLDKYLEDSHRLVYKHAIKADAIDGSGISDSLMITYLDAFNKAIITSGARVIDSTQGGAKKKDVAFYEGQLQSTKFFINTVLPVTHGKMASIKDFDGSSIEIDDAGFGGL